MQNRRYQRIGVFVVGFLVILLLIYQKRQEFVQEESTYVEEQESKNLSATLEESDLIEKQGLEEEEADIKENIFIREKEYVNEYQDNYVHISYPQITGFFEEEKEQRINSIIEEELKKVLVEKLRAGGNLYFCLEGNVTLLNKKIISIFYKGSNGGNKNAGEKREFSRGLIIAVEEEKVLVLNDMITDIKKLKKVLREDQFEPITNWNSYSKQIEYEPFMEVCFEEDYRNGIYHSGDIHMEWYTNGEYFNLIFDMGMCSYEYSAAIDSIRYLFSEEILNLLKQEEFILEEEELSIEKESMEEKENEINDFIQKRGNWVLMNIPQFNGFYEKEKEEKINTMIEEDAKKILREADDLYEEKELYFDFFYRIKFVNKNIISIFYQGSLGARTSSRYPAIEEMATTIDIQNEKILTLSDIILDFDKLKKLLVEDEFESITLWDGTTCPFSSRYGKDPDKLGCLDESRIHGEYQMEESSHTDWYTDGENFYIVIGEYRSFYEFKIEINKIRDILSEKFLELLEEK